MDAVTTFGDGRQWTRLDSRRHCTLQLPTSTRTARTTSSLTLPLPASPRYNGEAPWVKLRPDESQGLAVGGGFH
jgi:hypothetical protein